MLPTAAPAAAKFALYLNRNNNNLILLFFRVDLFLFLVCDLVLLMVSGSCTRIVYGSTARMRAFFTFERRLILTPEVHLQTRTEHVYELETASSRQDEWEHRLIV